MHPTVVTAAGYTLLLSSFITLVFLLRKRCGKKNKSPFYILSTSDIFSAILTAIILLVNRIEAGVKLSYNWQNNSLDHMPNRTWTIEEEESHQLPFLQIRHLREADLDVTLTCDMKDTFMQYGILLAALTNAFVSLLTLTLQCNLTAACIKGRCTDIMKSLTNDIQLKSKDVKVTHRERKISEDGQESALQRQDNIDNGKNESNFLQKIIKSSKFRIASKGDKPVKLFVTSHWLVPFLVVAILYFAGYDDMNTIRHTDTECVFGSNFPMNDFYIFSDIEDNLKIMDSIMYTTPIGNKYFVNEELLSKVKPSDAEVDEIVFKVQKIVNSALNYTDNSSENTRNTDFLATSGLQNMTNYVIANDIINYIKSNINIHNVTERLNDTLTEQNVSIHDASSNTNNNIESNQDLQASLFHDLLKNASEKSVAATFGNPSDVYNISDDDYRKDAQIYPASTEENQKTNQKTANVAIMQNKISSFNNQILYNNIIKRIQGAIKNHNRTVNRHDHAKQPKWNNLKNYIANRKPNSIKNLFSSKNDDFNHYLNTEMKNGTRHMINECLISIKFLQLYLFVLFFVIYFLSILLSCTLQMRGKHVCESTRAILSAKTDIVSILCNKDNKTNIINVLPQVPMDDKGNHDSMEESNMSQQEARNDHGSRLDIEVIEEDCNNDREIKDENLFLEIDCMIRIFNTIKLSFILCIILWTPMLLGILLRVFSCISAPQWLIDTTFLSATSFGTIRNILNMYIIKIQEICNDARVRDNRIHPVK